MRVIVSAASAIAQVVKYRFNKRVAKPAFKEQPLQLARLFPPYAVPK